MSDPRLTVRRVTLDASGRPPAAARTFPADEAYYEPPRVAGPAEVEAEPLPAWLQPEDPGRLTPKQVILLKRRIATCLYYSKPDCGCSGGACAAKRGFGGRVTFEDCRACLAQCDDPAWRPRSRARSE